MRHLTLGLLLAFLAIPPSYGGVIETAVADWDRIVNDGIAKKLPLRTPQGNQAGFKAINEEANQVLGLLKPCLADAQSNIPERTAVEGLRSRIGWRPGLEPPIIYAYLSDQLTSVLRPAVARLKQIQADCKTVILVKPGPITSAPTTPSPKPASGPFRVYDMTHDKARVARGGRITFDYKWTGDAAAAGVTHFSFAVRGVNKTEVLGKVAGTNVTWTVPSNWPIGDYVMRVDGVRTSNSDGVWFYSDSPVFKVE